MAAKALLAAALLHLLCGGMAACAPSMTVVTVIPAQRLQVISGWEVTATAPDPTEWAGAPRLRRAVYDRAVEEVGVNRVRLPIRSGAESTSRGYLRYVRGELTAEAWRPLRYATANDNADPRTINWAGFDFSELDANIELGVLPLKQRLEARGERLFVNCNYTAFTGQITRGDYIHDDPEEYAEFVLAAYLHMREKYGFVPDAWEVILEPDLVKQWPDGVVLGRAMAASARRLREHGFTPRFIAPSVTDMANTTRYLDGIVSTPGALEVLDEISYHRYQHGSSENAKAIAARANQLGRRTSMLELWFGKATSDVLFEDLVVAQASAWQGRTLWGLFDRDASAPDELVLKPDVRTNLQVFRYVRGGAVRVQAASSDRRFTPAAFINPDGRWVLTLNASGDGALTVRGLPPGRYQVSYALRQGLSAQRGVILVTHDQPLLTTMPGQGVLTIHQIG